MNARLAHAAGLSYRQLDYWARKGYLRVENPGTGHDRDWPPRELRIAAEMSRLIAAGMTVPGAAAVARAGMTCRVLPMLEYARRTAQ